MYRYGKCWFIALGIVGIIGSARAQSPIKACTLLTKAQVAAALGVAVDPGVQPIAADPRMCNWRESNKPTGPGRNVMLTLINAKEFANIQKQPHSVATDGIGDEAIVTHTMRVPAVLTVRSGDHYFRILVRSGLEAADDRNQALEKALAAQVLKKL